MNQPTQVVQFLIRFLAGGLVIGGLPLLAQRVSPGLAGLLIQVPVISFATFYFIGRLTGKSGTLHAAVGALEGLPVYIVAVGAVLLGLQRGLTVSGALGIGAAAWALALATVIVITGAYR